MKTYFNNIKLLQTVLLGASILILLFFPLVLVFLPGGLSEQTILRIYDVSHVSVFLVMFIRPLADIWKSNKWVRPLVILRKGVGVLSASIVVSLIFAKLITDPSAYFESLRTLKYWSMTNFALLGHLADMSALILLITSNNLSKRILGTGWKRVQKLSYVFFYASSLYVYLSYGNVSVLISMIIITLITLLAFIKNRAKVQTVTP